MQPAANAAGVGATSAARGTAAIAVRHANDSKVQALHLLTLPLLQQKRHQCEERSGGTCLVVADDVAGGDLAESGEDDLQILLRCHL